MRQQQAAKTGTLARDAAMTPASKMAPNELYLLGSIPCIVSWYTAQHWYNETDCLPPLRLDYTTRSPHSSLSLREAMSWAAPPSLNAKKLKTPAHSHISELKSMSSSFSQVFKDSIPGQQLDYNFMGDPKLELLSKAVVGFLTFRSCMRCLLFKVGKFGG